MYTGTRHLPPTQKSDESKVIQIRKRVNISNDSNFGTRGAAASHSEATKLFVMLQSIRRIS
jgi:hypothetical protein